jgi:5-methylcytosine-specific restriction endonuclease McrA
MNEPYNDLNPAPRYKFIFTKTQKRDWIGLECAYCFAASDLVIDHIIPVICGGNNVKSNAQTLCQDCNRWKMKYVDRPLYFAVLERERGSDA